MAKIIVTKTTATKVFEFAGQDLNVKGEVIYDPKTLEIERLSGSFYEKADPETGINGAYVGNFDGMYVDGSLRYSIRDMTAENALRVTGLVAEVDEYAQQIVQTEEPEDEPVEDPVEE